MKKVLYISITLFILICGCNNQNFNDKTELINTTFNDIKTIEVNKVKEIEAYWRNQNLLVVRINYPHDSLEYGIPILLRSIYADQVSFKYGKDWIVADSIDYYFNISGYENIREKVIYTFHIMNDLGISSINNLSNTNRLFVKKDSLIFCYVYDSLEITNFDPLIRIKVLEGNWLLLE